MKLPLRPIALVCALASAISASAYPLFGSDDRRIRRLEGTRLAHDGAEPGREKLAGETLSLEQVDLRLTSRASMELPPVSESLTSQIRGLLGGEASLYGVAVLDLSNRDAPVYAEHRADIPSNPGSVGKIAIGLALFQALADAYPNDTAARMRVLTDTKVTANEFIVHDSHTVRLWDAASGQMNRRPLRVGDTGTLFEFLDWMLSASSNAAASIVLQQAMLLKHFASAYPPSASEGDGFFDQTPKKDLSALLEQTLEAPLARNGLDPGQFRQGSFFTHTGKQKVPGNTSYATPRALIMFLLQMEKGRLVDEWSSRELKRLLYMTERRIRYASSPALQRSAVYFKSGSWFGCAEEPGFTCRKYHGNVRNFMNSVAIVETPAGVSSLYYMVALTSNVLRRNSAVEHQTLATRIHRIIEAAHGYRER